MKLKSDIEPLVVGYSNCTLLLLLSDELQCNNSDVYR